MMTNEGQRDAAMPQGRGMQAVQRYILTAYDLFVLREGVTVGADAEIAILDGASEIDRMCLSGKVGPGHEGCRRSYFGKPGLIAKLVTGPGRIHFSRDLTPGE